ncbi:MAG: hypothetical protein K9L68_07055, partial [Spirochaetales bacterium]|nr:hypothetical protein [Spirochaetales bacterium]MCF7938342.1 hypothetical protein [Spirochaetales bacterium]
MFQAVSRKFLNLFSRKPRLSPEDISWERWETSRFSGKDQRFEEAEGADYRAYYDPPVFRLELDREYQFAWVVDRWYRYRDFVLDAEIRFDTHQGECASGFLLRYLDDGNYYAFLVSNQGRFRFDVVMNGTLYPLIGWTETEPVSRGDTGSDEQKEQNEQKDRQLVNMRIVLRGNRCFFAADDQWLAELEDDSLDAGRIAFAGQNYGEGEGAGFTLQRILLESRPVEVEAEYQRMIQFAGDPSRRIILARSLLAGGQSVSAAVQLKKAFAEQEPAAGEAFLLAEALFRSGLYSEALQAADLCLKKDPDYQDAKIEKANLLYLLNRFEDLSGFFAENEELSRGNPLMANLRGNNAFALGRYEEAARWYELAQAPEEANELPSGFSVSVFSENEGGALIRIGRRQEALEAYLRAAQGYFTSQNYQDLRTLLTKIEQVDRGDPRAAAVRGKIAFLDGEYRSAREDLAKGVELADAASAYLLGLIEEQTGHRREADFRYVQATQLDPEESLYFYRLAELRFGEKSAEFREPLEQARKLSPEDPWVLNLIGQDEYRRGSLLNALEAFRTAWNHVCAAGPGSALPGREDVTDILINYTALMAENASGEQALQIVDAYLLKAEAAVQEAQEEGEEDQEACELAEDLIIDPIRLLNHRGNLLADRNELERALSSYESAIRRNPADPLTLENCAAVCLRLDRYSRAEECLAVLLSDERALEAAASVYRLTGDLAFLKGEVRRAETAYN